MNFPDACIYTEGRMKKLISSKFLNSELMFMRILISPNLTNIPGFFKPLHKR